MGAIKLYRGVSIYQVDGSQNWYVRIWNREKQRYIVKATGQTSAAKAREVALSHALTLLKTSRSSSQSSPFGISQLNAFLKTSRLSVRANEMEIMAV